MAAIFRLWQGIFLRPRLVGFGWMLAAGLVALSALTPVLSLVWTAVQGESAHWQHLLKYVLPEAARNTILLLLGVGCLALLLGIATAWMVTAYAFPGRRFLAWALLLPLAMPSYIVAFAYTDLLHPIGPVQTAVRALLGYSSPRQWSMSDVRSLPGAIVLLGLVLYPYVYLSARAAFLTQSMHLIEAARSLGCASWRVLSRVVIPLARPTLVVGLSFVLMETLNDIGASEFLGVHTLTVSIYTTWGTRSDLAGAAQIAVFLLALVMLVVSLEQHGRAHRRFACVQEKKRMQRKRLHQAGAWLVPLFTALPVVFGFLLPAAYLVYQSIERVGRTGDFSSALLSSLFNTLALALAVVICVLLAGMIVAWGSRQSIISDPATHWFVRLASLGYAIPGTVLAIGLMPPALKLDSVVAEKLQLAGLPLMAAGVWLLFGCSLRFLAITANGIQAGLARQVPALEQAARLLGETSSSVLWRVHLPLLRPALASSAMLVFVDAMKELPVTLLLRPVNFETLSTLLYAEAARGAYEDGALAALAIVLAGIIPVMLLAWQQERDIRRESPSIR